MAAIVVSVIVPAGVGVEAVVIVVAGVPFAVVVVLVAVELECS